MKEPLGLIPSHLRLSDRNSAVYFCPGIDPDPGLNSSLSDFKRSLAAHKHFLQTCPYDFKFIKINFAFFIQFGSSGITLLEEFVAEFSPRFKIILDAKFGEVSNTLKAYLVFAFQTLKVTGLTINPFLGEETLGLAFESAAKHIGPEARVYVLCATSETGHGSLGFISQHTSQILQACISVRDKIFGYDRDFSRLAGVVVGANRHEVLFGDELRFSKLSVLSPGLGPQGADWGTVKKVAAETGEPREICFPVQRALFGGGNLTDEQINTNFEKIRGHFAV